MINPKHTKTPTERPAEANSLYQLQTVSTVHAAVNRNGSERISDAELRCDVLHALCFITGMFLTAVAIVTAGVQ